MCICDEMFDLGICITIYMWFLIKSVKEEFRNSSFSVKIERYLFFSWVEKIKLFIVMLLFVSVI